MAKTTVSASAARFVSNLRPPLRMMRVKFVAELISPSALEIAVAIWKLVLRLRKSI